MQVEAGELSPRTPEPPCPDLSQQGVLSALRVLCTSHSCSARPRDEGTSELAVKVHPCAEWGGGSSARAEEVVLGPGGDSKASWAPGTAINIQTHECVQSAQESFPDGKIETQRC